MLSLRQRQWLARRSARRDDVAELLRDRHLPFDGGRANRLHQMRSEGASPAELRAFRKLLDEMDDRR